jgi:MFS family permease
LILGGRVFHGLGEVPLWALAPALLSILRPTHKASIIGWYNATLHLGLTSGSIFGFAVHGQLTEHQVFVIFTSLCILAGILTLMCGDENATSSVTPETRFNNDNRKLFFQLIKDRRILCVLSGITVYGAGYGVYLTIIPSFLLKGDQFSHTSVGWLFIGFYVGISLAQLVGGYIADKRGRVLPMVTGMLLFALGQILFPRFTMGIAIGSLSIASFGLGLFLIGSIAILNDQVGNKSKGLVSGIFYLFWGCGYFAGPLILGYAGELGLYVQGFSSLGILAGTIGILLIVSKKDMVTNIDQG